MDPGTMCKGCLDAVREIWGDLPDDEMMYLLYNATPFPVGGPEDVRAALLKAHKESGGSTVLAVAMAEEQMEAECRADWATDVDPH